MKTGPDMEEKKMKTAPCRRDKKGSERGPFTGDRKSAGDFCWSQ